MAILILNVKIRQNVFRVFESGKIVLETKYLQQRTRLQSALSFVKKKETVPLPSTNRDQKGEYGRIT